MKNILFIIIFFVSIVSIKASYIEINLINFADIYNLRRSNYGSGLLSLKKILKDIKSQEKNVLICSSGDILLTNGIERLQKGKVITKILNELNIDVAGFGNHEFAFGIEELEKRISESNFQWIGSNIRKIIRNSNHYTELVKLKNTRDIVIYEISGIKIGFFSICLPETCSLYPKACLNKIIFLDIFNTVSHYINELKSQNVDIIVAITHLDFTQDIELSNQFPDINIILGAHDHKNISFFNGKTLIHKAGSDAGFIGQVIIKYNKKQKKLQLDWRTLNNNFNIIKN